MSACGDTTCPVAYLYGSLSSSRISITGGGSRGFRSEGKVGQPIALDNPSLRYPYLYPFEDIPLPVEALV
jgi:hypothetical protein